MPTKILATTKKRCAYCGKRIEIGEPITFGSIRNSGVDRTVPVHFECGKTPEDRAAEKKLAAVIAEAAVNGHGNPQHYITEEVRVAELSLIAELKNEIERSKNWGNNFVTHKRLESIITKHEVQVPGDISKQPGEWQIRGGYVDAIQVDGGADSGLNILHWIFDRGGKAKLIRDIDEDVTRVLLDSPRQPNLAGPGWWIVRTADDIFYALSDEDFHVLYVPREDVPKSE